MSTPSRKPAPRAPLTRELPDVLPWLVAALLALLLWSPAARAATPPPATPAPTDTIRLTLEQAVAHALASSNEMIAAEAGIGVAEGRVKEVMAEALPQITASGSYNRKLDSIYRGVAESDTSGLGGIFADSPFGALNTWSFDVTGSQLLWSGGRVGAGLAAAKAVRRSTHSDRDQTGADVSLVVQAAYWDALYTREVQRIAENTLRQARDRVKQSELFQKQGIRSEYDLLQAQVDAANQQPAVVAAMAAARVSLLQLRRTLNLPLSQPLVLESSLRFQDSTILVPEGPTTDVSARPALLSAQAVVDAREALVRVEKAGRWPNLVASANMSHQAFPPNGAPASEDFLRSMDATLKLEWPLFQGFRTFGAVQRASNELRQAQAQRDDAMQLTAELELAQAQLAVQEAIATLAARRGTAKLAERAHHLADVRWRNGMGTPLEVSDALLRMQDSQVREVLALKDYRLSLARLERAAGRPVPLISRHFDEFSFDDIVLEDPKP
jgi:outer membrane protein TolC